ncbi:ABC transporter substrate-binding protein [Streptomyces sp. NPDC046716]|uniref:ABC transporter substrate-binding protein n=1 Tax=Streptomyces sp. NPDC046716 TaxID=3157093 RepID=UPI0033CDAEB2
MTSQRARTRTGWTVAVTTALALLVAGCADGDAKGSGDARQLTVAALPLTDSAALYIARDRGLFTKEGLDVRIQAVQQSIQALPALSKGDQERGRPRGQEGRRHRTRPDSDPRPAGAREPAGGGGEGCAGTGVSTRYGGRQVPGRTALA